MPYVAVPDHLAGDVFSQTNWQTHIEGNLNAGVERPLYDIILGGSAASVDITSIPATFAHLRLICYLRGDTAAASIGLQLRFDNDSTAGSHQYQLFLANGTTLTGAEGASVTSITLGSIPAATAAAGFFGGYVIEIPGYTRTNAKSVEAICGFRSQQAANGGFSYRASGWYNGTAATSRLTLFPAVGSFVAGSRVTLLGVPYI